MIGWLSTLPLVVADSFRRDPAALMLMTGQSPWGWRTLEVAKSCIGMGESGGNNLGPDIDHFRQGHGKRGGSWCAHFVSYCLREAWGELESISCPIPHTAGARRLWKRAGRLGRLVERPSAGDLVLWDRGQEGSWKAHIAIVSRVDGDRFWVVEGNRWRYPSQVEVSRGDSRGRLRGFARLPAVGP